MERDSLADRTPSMSLFFSNMTLQGEKIKSPNKSLQVPFLGNTDTGQHGPVAVKHGLSRDPILVVLVRVSIATMKHHDPKASWGGKG